MDLIRQNLHKYQKTFFEKLYEDGFFDNNKFDELTEFIIDLSNTDLSKEDQLNKAVEIWELGFSIQQLITNHYDKNDTYKITNLIDDKLRQLTQIVYYFCNWFTYNKPLEKDCLTFGKW